MTNMGNWKAWTIAYLNVIGTFIILMNREIREYEGDTHFTIHNLVYVG